VDDGGPGADTQQNRITLFDNLLQLSGIVFVAGMAAFADTGATVNDQGR
jgi:hypothetical protein